jgi:glycosyltransferase involved in cell wall biosynthesis
MARAVPVTAPEVTVVIPTRDRRAVLERTLGAALAQVDVELEIVVVDDGSDDGTSTYLADHPDPRVRAVRHAQSRGVAAARNSGIGAAAAAWIAFLDDDDLWAPRKLRAQLDAAAARDAGFVYGAVVIVDEQLRVLRGPLAGPDPDVVAEDLLRSNPMPGGCSNPMARADLVRQVGGFDEDLLQLSDWDLWIRLAGAARCARADDCLVAYVRHPANMIVTGRNDVFAELDRMVAKHGPAMAREVNRLEIARWVAWGRWRSGSRRDAARVYSEALMRDANRRDIALLARQLARRLRPRPAVPAPAWLEQLR